MGDEEEKRRNNGFLSLLHTHFTVLGRYFYSLSQYAVQYLNKNFLQFQYELPKLLTLSPSSLFPIPQLNVTPMYLQYTYMYMYT